MHFRVLLSTFLLLSTTAIFGGEADTFFQNGNTAFQQGNFAEATKNYESALALGQCSAALYANLGHAFFKQKQWGRAILNYERALLLRPDEDHLNTDLDLARKSAGLENHRTDNQILLVTWWKNVLDTDPPDTWAWVAVLLIWLAGAGFWHGWRSTTPLKRRVGYWAAIVFGSTFLLAMALALNSAARARDCGYGIVLAKKTYVFPAPDRNVEPLDTISEGEKVAVPDSISGWWKVVLPTGEEGWAARADLERI